MPGAGHHLIDLIEQLRGQQADIVFQYLQPVALIEFEDVVAQKLANRLVFLGDVVQLVLVPVAVEPQSVRQ